MVEESKGGIHSSANEGGLGSLLAGLALIRRFNEHFGIFFVYFVCHLPTFQTEQPRGRWTEAPRGNGTEFCRWGSRPQKRHLWEGRGSIPGSADTEPWTLRTSPCDTSSDSFRRSLTRSIISVLSTCGTCRLSSSLNGGWPSWSSSWHYGCVPDQGICKDTDL